MIFKTTLKFSVVCFAGLVGCANVSAQTPAVSSILTASIVSVVNGNTVKKPAVDAKPGDVIEYSTTYANNSKAPVERMLASIPIPEGTTLLDQTAVPANAAASLDAVTFSAIPLMRTIKSSTGSIRMEPVPLGEYRAVRWALPTMAADQKATVSVNVRVNATAALAAPAASTPVKP